MAQHNKQLQKDTSSMNSTERPRRAIQAVTLKPAEVAFLGEYESEAETRSVDEKSLFVQVLCWSRTAQGWSALNESWDAMRAYRDETTLFARSGKTAPVPPSWVYEVTPKLGGPFRENPAEESTLAAWISRAQISFAIAIVDKSCKDSEGAFYRAALLESLGSYQAFLESPAYAPCRLIMAAEHPQQRQSRLVEAFRDARLRLQNQTLFETMQLQSCSAGKFPLPLELANLSSAAIVRYLNSPSASNPIYDAIRLKLASVPTRITVLESSRRR